MRYFSRCLFAIPLTASMVCAGAAYGTNGIVTTKLPTANGPLAADAGQTKGHANPLPAPPPSQVKFETLSSKRVPGVRLSAKAKARAATRAFGSFGIPYTSTRVEHYAVLDLDGAARNLLSTSYPYS